MPPKKQSPLRPASTTSSRPGRVTKNKAKETIRKATASSRAASHARSRASQHSVSPVPSRARTASRGRPSGQTTPVRPRTPPPRTSPPSSPASSSSESRSITADHPDLRESIMQDVRLMVRGYVREAIQAAHVEQGLVTGTDPSTLISPAMPQHVLSRWPWVPEDTVKSIAFGQFEIDSLPKLHRSDELRNAYLKRSRKGIYHALDGSAPEIIVGTSKLQSSFKDPATFFLAWHVYVSIRTAFKPEMGPRLASWTERLQYFVQLNYPWSSILEYVIAFYQLYQNNCDGDAWFNPDPTLMAYHLTLVQQKAPATSSGSTSSRAQQSGTLRPKPTGEKREAMGAEICGMFNQPSGCRWKDKDGGKCPRRHVCNVCISSNHSRPTCPDAKKLGPSK